MLWSRDKGWTCFRSLLRLVLLIPHSVVYPKHWSNYRQLLAEYCKEQLHKAYERVQNERSGIKIVQGALVAGTSEDGVGFPR